VAPMTGEQVDPPDEIRVTLTPDRWQAIIL
jgi:hypothetical protein